VPSHLIPIHPDNTKSKDWVILLEAGTIVGPSPDKLRVARFQPRPRPHASPPQLRRLV